jgi:2-C-methyl-D-erythritol 4-phosphate cytidylyltransferase
MATAIIVAAGRGIRMGGHTRKQYLLLSGKPVLAYTLEAFSAVGTITTIYLVVPEADFEFCEKELVGRLDVRQSVVFVAGGSRRQDSVYNGLQSIQEKEGIVVIHDGVRPLVLPDQIGACIEVAESHGSCILGMPVSDTLKRADGSNRIFETLDRSDIWYAQTPQAFRLPVVLQAHEKARSKGITGTDDAYLVEQLGHKVKIIAGSRENIKITTPSDLRVAEAILQYRG